MALALFALVLQTLAPLEILPPRGQAVHFAHVHHGGDGNHRGSHGTSRQDAPACPVCQALQAGGTSIGAPALLLALVPVVHFTSAPPTEIVAPAGPALARPHARGPPMSV